MFGRQTFPAIVHLVKGFEPLTDVVYEAVGAKIRERREAAGLTQGVLASHVGLSRASVANIERGRQALYVHQLLSFSKALGVAPSTFISATDEKIHAIDKADHPPEFMSLLGKLRAGNRRR